MKKYAHVALILAVVFSVFDAWFTLHYVSIGHREANPLMAYVLDAGPLPFLFLKVVAIPAVLGIVYSFRAFSTAVVGLWVVAAYYAPVILVHVFFFTKGY